MRLSRLLSLPLLLMLAACNFFAPEPVEQTRVAGLRSMATQLTDIQATATAAADRLNATTEYVQTAVRSVDTQSTRIASTLMALGTPFVSIAGINLLQPTPTFLDEGQGAVNSAVDPGFVAPTISGAGAARANVTLAPPVPEMIALPSPTPDPTQPSLGNITLSAAVGSDDCASAPQTSFSASASSIYIVATGYNLTSANRITSVWLREGVEVARYDWSPRNRVQGACIWFYITPQAVSFDPGTWSVELLLDGVSAGLTPFTIQSM